MVLAFFATTVCAASVLDYRGARKKHRSHKKEEIVADASNQLGKFNEIELKKLKEDGLQEEERIDDEAHNSPEVRQDRSGRFNLFNLKRYKFKQHL